MSPVASVIFNKKFKQKNLTSLYEKKINGILTAGLDGIRSDNFSKKLPEEISIIVKKVNNGSYNFTNYKEKLISKGRDDKPRVLSIPTIRDRLVLKTLSELLSELYPTAKSVLPQEKIKTLSNELDKEKYNRYIKIDLSKFYPSIPQERLLKKLKEKIRKKELLSLIDKAISTGTSSHGGKKKKNKEGVPQGLSISNILAEIYLMDLDDKMAKKTDLYYSRYVDDILILCKSDDIINISKEIIKDIKSLGLTPHEFTPDSKSKIGSIESDKFEFLGYNFFDSKLTPKKSSILRFENNVAGVLTSFKYKYNQAKTIQEKESTIALCMWKLNLKITGCIHKNTRLGWFFYFSQTNCSTPFRQIDSTIKALIKRLNMTAMITPKKVLKAFYESSVGNKNQHKYIINFDKLTISDKRDILSLYLSPSKVMTMHDDLVIKMFERRLRDSIKDLEKDIGHNS